MGNGPLLKLRHVHHCVGSLLIWIQRSFNMIEELESVVLFKLNCPKRFSLKIFSCSFFSLFKEVDAATKLGLAIHFVLTITVPPTGYINNFY